MRHLLMSLAGLLLLAGVANAEPKFGFIDMQRALIEVDEGKQAKADLEKMKKARQGKLNARQEELRGIQKNLEAQKDFMKADVRKAKEAEFREKLQGLQMTYAKLQKELAMEEAKITKKIFARMSRILMKMGKEGNYTMMFEKGESGLVWGQPHLDLTNELIRRFNAGEGKGKGKKKGKRKGKKGKK